MQNVELPVVAINSISYLDDVAKNLQEFQLPETLKSYYLTKCRITERIERITLPQKAVDPSIRCPKCATLYVENDQTKYLIKRQRKKNRFDRRLLKKQEAGTTLTDFQEKFLKRRVNSDNQFVLKCGTCKREQRTNLVKPDKSDDKKEENHLSTTLTEQRTPNLERKKKRKRDRFSGLNIYTNESNEKIESLDNLRINNNGVSIKSNNNKKYNNSKTEIKSPSSSRPTTPNKLNAKNSSANNNNHSGKKTANSKIAKLNKMNTMLNKSSKPKKSPSSKLKNFLLSIQN